MRLMIALSGLVVGASGVLALAQPVVDGRITTTPTADGYGAPKWVNRVPTSFGDSVAITSIGNPGSVGTGVELVIPLSAIGLNGPTYPSTVRVCVLLTSPDGGYLSNQFIPSLPINTRNLGFTGLRDLGGVEPDVAGLQFIDLAIPVAATEPVTIDGVRDEPGGANPYGSASSLQGNFTDFGKAKHGLRGGGQGLEVNGSEIDAVYARVVLPPVLRPGEEKREPEKLAKPGITDAQLHLFVGGNIEANGNKIVVFFDTTPGVGQQQLALMPNPAYAGLTGLTFDAGFAPDYAVGVTCCAADLNASPPTYCLFADYFMDDGAGTMWFTFHAGNRVFPNTGPLADTSGDLTGADVGAPVLRAALDNSNTQGVARAPVLPANRDVANGSEIDAVYSKMQGGRLYVLVTGNIKADETKLHLFFDTGQPGQNVLLPSPSWGVPGNVTVDTGTWTWFNPAPNYDGLGRMGPDQFTGVPQPGFPLGFPLNGLRFDFGFQASYWIMVTNARWAPIDVQSWAAVLRPNGRRTEVGWPDYAKDYSAFDGGPKGLFDPMAFSGPRVDAFDLFQTDIFANYGPRLVSDLVTGIGSTPDPTGLEGLLRVALDNSNVAGNTDTTASTAGATAVTTGVELSIDLVELGWSNNHPIRLAGFLSSHDYKHVSNQVIGGIPWSVGSPVVNLGDARQVFFDTIASDQSVLIWQIPPCNAADIATFGGELGADGILTVDDLVAFLTRFFSGDANVADLTGPGGGSPDGAVTVDDLVRFLSLFFSTCNP